MAGVGSQVPWWRVVNAAGRLPSHLTAEASRHWAEEGTRAVDGRCLMPRARADLARLAAEYEALAD
jgi:6-O-methylguanine DNA methyltransferase